MPSLKYTCGLLLRPYLYALEHNCVRCGACVTATRWLGVRDWTWLAGRARAWACTRVGLRDFACA
eukprot:5950982-Pleurochrysis_carterae.AAC.2